MRSKKQGLLAFMFCLGLIIPAIVVGSVATTLSFLDTDSQTQPNIHGDVARRIHRADAFHKDDSIPKPMPPLHVGCDVLDVPSTVSWEKHHENVTKWAKEQFNIFESSGHESFPQFLRDQFAPDLSPSSVFCDHWGTCTLGSCRSLDQTLSAHDQQMAWLVFEQIAGFVHHYKIVFSSLHDSASQMQERIPNVVDTFSVWKRIDKQREERRKSEKILFAVGQAIGLLATSGIGIVTSIFPEFAPAKAVFDTYVNGYISATNLVNNIRSNEFDSVEKIKENIAVNFNNLAAGLEDTLVSDLRKFAKGEVNHRNQSMLSILTGEYYFQDPDQQVETKGRTEKTFYAVLVDALWRYERAYILVTHAENGNCNSDTRGPIENRICLPEALDTSYWLYAIDPSQEGGGGHDQGQIHGPTGYRAFWSTNSASHYDITSEDIVRSSLFVDQNNLHAAIDTQDFDTLRNAFTNHRMQGDFHGSFAIPICRNAGGESISSVWQDGGRNYPCMCGGNHWSGINYDLKKDQTPKFLALTGLMFSEDWEDYCFTHNHCDGVTGYDLHGELNGYRFPGDPQIPEHLLYPFYRCKEMKKHEPGKPNRDPPLGGGWMMRALSLSQNDTFH